MDWQKLLDDCVDFTQRLIQTPSRTWEEAEIAALIADEMRGLQFDEIWMDEIGNVNGRIFGTDRTLPATVLNSHTDHVDPGDPTLWPVPPFSGEIVDGRILGRGACDIKGPLAVQVYSMGALLRNGERPRRDTVFSGVVAEEIGGDGASHWIKNLDYPVDLVVLGEPSNNTISLGHRGAIGMWIKFLGRSVHASVPQNGENPNYYLSTFLQRLAERSSELSAHPYLGKTTVAPTIIEVDTKSSNVTPAWTRVLLDCRTSSASPKEMVDFYTSLAHDMPHEISSGWSGIPLDKNDTTPLSGYDTPPDSETAVRSQQFIQQGVGHDVPFTSYQFATDGRLFPPYGVKNIIGYSAAEEELAHTIKESISIEKMMESLRGHVELLRHF